MVEKSHKVKFSIGTHSSKGIFDFVHADIWGPTRAQSKEEQCTFFVYGR